MSLPDDYLRSTKARCIVHSSVQVWQRIPTWRKAYPGNPGGPHKLVVSGCCRRSVNSDGCFAPHWESNSELAFGVALLSIVTIAIAWALGALIAALLDKREPPRDLLRSAVALWCSNVLVFASWYWRLDAGGPHKRELRASHTEGAFLFAQMTVQRGSKLAPSNWKPGFVDYLFLAFNTSTAFSPTDVPVLSRWAKVLMIVQSCISLGTVAILAARAINIL